MWLTNSSIGRKVIMSVTGVSLILFLTFHACMNIVAIFDVFGKTGGEHYNWVCEMLGTNWYALVGTAALAVLVVLHFVYALILTLQNKKARGSNKYAVTDRPAKVEWESQNMFVIGLIVVLGLCLHLFNFWWNMMAAELMGAPAIEATDGYRYMCETFGNPVFLIIYLVWFAALWFHLNHGMWSAMQTLGWNGKTWFCRWKCIGQIYTTIIILMFVAVALVFAFCA